MLPLFPTALGETVHKDKVIEQVDEAFVQLGLPLQTPDGRNTVGGHVFRVSGSRHLVRVGVDLRIVKILARWETEQIMGYVKEVPLETLTAAYRQRNADKEALTTNVGTILAQAPATQSRASSSILASFTPFKKATLEKIERLNDRCHKLELELQATCDKLKVLDDGVHIPYVISTKGEGVYHVTSAYKDKPIDEVTTKCGWPYLKWASPYDRIGFIDVAVDYKRLCKRCLRIERARRRALAPRDRFDRSPSPLTGS